MSAYQLPLHLDKNPIKKGISYQEKLANLLGQDLDFHGEDSGYAGHNFHSFPAKFPPQLPRKFIHALTQPGEVVLDPMMGSGTTLLETLLAGRRAIGCDIDPLAAKISQVKVTAFNEAEVRQTGETILQQARLAVQRNQETLVVALTERFDPKTRVFVDYWFAPETQMELMALIREIEKIADPQLRAFFELAFSAIIITKTGGVSFAFDLAHTRPHRAKMIYSQDGKIILGREWANSSNPRVAFLTKTLRSPLEEFQRRVEKNLQGLFHFKADQIPLILKECEAQCLPLEDASVDLIVTSPPYASNAIDYMRAHKFALVWFGYPIGKLSNMRGEYIGGESSSKFEFEPLPTFAENIVRSIGDLDNKKGRVLHRYYSEMTHTFREMYRVLRPEKVAIVIVGNSIIRGQDTQTATCLAEIGKAIGFDVPKIGIRNLDRNRRMLPAGQQLNLDSQIQQRMHKDYIICFYKSK